MIRMGVAVNDTADEGGRTALYHAVLRGHHHAVLVLLRLNAAVDLCTKAWHLYVK